MSAVCQDTPVSPFRLQHILLENTVHFDGVVPKD
jgi:hypothetical protein